MDVCSLHKYNEIVASVHMTVELIRCGELARAGEDNDRVMMIIMLKDADEWDQEDTWSQSGDGHDVVVFIDAFNGLLLSVVIIDDS